MSILDYFSKDENRRAKFIFNLIAPFYGRIAKSVEENHRASMEKLAGIIDIKGKTVLDVGSGSGAWAKLFAQYGAEKVTGIDLAEKMVKVASEVYPEIEFFECNGEEMRKIQDNSYDIVTASFVLHGVKAPRRKMILEQMKRVARQYVVIRDFAGKVSLSVQILEALERSDFRNFKKNFCTEMRQVFGNCQMYATGNNGGLYVGKVKSERSEKK